MILDFSLDFVAKSLLKSDIAGEILSFTGGTLMAVTQIRGNTQIMDLTILDGQINAAAAIATTKLAQGPNFIQKDGSVAFTADQPMGGFKLTGLGAPVATTDAANKSYVDGVAQGLDVKESARIATTGTIANLSNASVIIDGVTLVAGDRVLVKDNASPDGVAAVSDINNGLYVVGAVNTGTAPFTRALDADSSAEVTAGMFCFVTEGTVNQDSGFVLATDNPITLGTTGLLFTQFTGTGQVTAGAGMTKTGNTLDVIAGNGVVVGANDVAVNIEGSTLTVAATGLKLTDLPSGKVLVGSAGNVATGVDLSGDVLISDTGVTSINTGVIVNGDVNASAAIAITKMANAAAGQIIVGAATTGAQSYVTMSGDITIDSAGATTISSGAITGTMLGTNTVALNSLVSGTPGQIIVGTTTSGVPTYVSMTGDITISPTGVTAIGLLAVTNGMLAGNIALNKLVSGTSAQIIVCNASGVPTYVALSGDVVIDNAGVATVSGAAIQDNFVVREVPTGAINGANTSFTLAVAPQAGTEMVFQNGLLQEVGAAADYQIAGLTITYNTAPVSGDRLFVTYIK